MANLRPFKTYPEELLAEAARLQEEIKGAKGEERKALQLQLRRIKDYLKIWKA